MKKFSIITLVAGLVSTGALAGVSITADLASAYVFRGVTLNDGFVVQPGIEASGLGFPEQYGSVTFGAWGNYDLDDYAPAGAVGSSFQETDWYGSYSLPQWVEGLELFVGYTEYSYGAGSSDKEANVGAGYEVVGIALGLTYYQGVGGHIGTSSYTEFALGYSLDFSDRFSGSVDARFGFVDQDGGETGFSDYDLGGSVSYALNEQWGLGATLTYIGQGDEDVLAKAPGAYDVDWVGMLSLSCAL